jgi:4-amino-4-deoxy-L-arabinose transferase-like glycosyltransferase
MGTTRSNIAVEGRRAITATRDATAWRGALLAAALLGLLALPPRVLGLADYFTTDEAYHWITRTERFSAAVAEGRWADTALTGHPGVTNMWLGSLGLWLERTLGGTPAAGPPALLTHLAWLRLPGALLQTLLVPLAYLLLRRLVSPATALAAAALWACSPYLIAHSRLLHLDALLTSFVTLSLLLLLRVNHRPPTTDHRPPHAEDVPAAVVTTGHRRISALASGGWPLVASGVFAGLALLTKGPALILLAFVFTLDAVAWLSDWRAGRGPVRSLVRRAHVRLVWLGAALLTVFALWPALWADPAGAAGRYVGEIVSNGGRPNGDGQFFLGRAAADPGPWFYLLADLFRATPVMLAGLLAFIAFAIRDVRVTLARRERTGILSRAEGANLHVLLAFVLFWTLVMTLGPKKFDRYVLPTWPALLVLAGYGLSRMYDLRSTIDDYVRRNRNLSPSGDRRSSHLAAAPSATPSEPVNRQGSQGSITSRLALGLLLAAELWQPLSVHPYYLSYYNPLLGGGVVAQRTFLIGWGEGMDQVGAWLRSRPDLGYGPVLSALGRTLQPFVPVDVRDVEDYGSLPANYAVVYLESVQRGAHPAIYEALQQTVPLHTVVINGIEYARIYQLPRPFATPLGARFGEGLALPGVTVAREPARITVTPSWDVRAQLSADYYVFVHVIDARGVQVARVDLPPGGAELPPTSAWQPGQQVSVPIPLDLPELPAGSYTLTMGVYDAVTGARLPLDGAQAADQAVAGDNALLLEQFSIP